MIKMELLKIYVNEIKHALNQQYSETYIEEFEPLMQEGDYFLMHEYSRGEQGKLLRIGVRAENAFQVVIQSLDTEVLLTRSKSMPDVWYEKRKYWFEGGYQESSETCFGMNACGEWKVLALDTQGRTLEEKRVIVLPCNMTYEQYQTMTAEVRSLFEWLAFSPENGDVLKELQQPLFPLEELVKLVKEMKEWIHEICGQPIEHLTRTRMRVSRSHINRWDGRTILEGVMFPFREQLSVSTTIRETNVDEHRMIRYMLEIIKERIVREMLVEHSAYQHLYKGLEGRKQTLEHLGRRSGSSNPFVNFLNAGRNEQQRGYRIGSVGNMNIREHIQKRVSIIEKELNQLQEREVIWKQCCASIDAMLNEPLFDVEPITPELTHNFIHNCSYGAVYELYERFEQLEPQLEPTEKEFIEAMVSSPHLYEVWILLKFLQQLYRVKFDFTGVIQSLVNKYMKDKTVSGWRHCFPFKEGSGECFIYYEPYIEVQGGNLKPDYLILYRAERGQNWQGHTLDAKYKPYKQLNQDVIVDDIQRSCYRYLNNIENDQVCMKSAALVHTDIHATHWNVNHDAVYTISHFSVLPGDTENLNVYFKRLFHYFGKRKKLCMSCGDMADVQDQGYKQTYICPNDGDVWVDNTCRHRQGHPLEYRSIDLMKYAFGNYNWQVLNQWDVHCPVCNRNYDGNVLNTDIFGR